MLAGRLLLALLLPAAARPKVKHTVEGLASTMGSTMSSSCRGPQCSGMAMLMLSSS
jgi:hypothetical protein